MSGLDLSGRWLGVFSYPTAAPPVSFTAWLSEQAGWIVGAVEEQSGEGYGPRRRLGASIEGRRAGLAVTWLKLYDDPSRGYDAVTYEGAVSLDGLEISGRWSIPSSWSGAFLMTRKPVLTAARRTRASARL